MTVQDQLGIWISQVQGNYINEDWNPENEGFGAQCWDLAANWSKFLGLPVINTGYPGRWVGWAGNMVSAYPQTREIEAAYQLVGPDQPGMAGDIAVWGDSYREYYPATHVAVLIRDAGAQLLCGSQNSTSSRVDNPYPKWSSGPATIQYLPRRGLIGFLRPRVGGINYQSITISEEDDMGHVDTISDAAAEAIALKLLAAQVQRDGAPEGHTNTLGWSLGAESPRTEGIIARTAEAAVQGVLFTKFPRQGPGQTGDTDLASVISWFDHGVQNAGSATPHDAPPIDPEQIKASISAAVGDALRNMDLTFTISQPSGQDPTA